MASTFLYYLISLHVHYKNAHHLEYLSKTSHRDSYIFLYFVFFLESRLNL